MRNKVNSSSSFGNSNTNNTNTNSIKEESSNDDTLLDDDVMSRETPSDNNSNNHDDDDDVDDGTNRVCRTKSHGELPYSETAAFQQINVSTTQNAAGSATELEVQTVLSDGELSTEAAHPGESHSRILRESPEYESVWKLYPCPQIQQLALHLYKYADISPLINNAQQLNRMLSGVEKC